MVLCQKMLFYDRIYSYWVFWVFKTFLKILVRRLGVSGWYFNLSQINTDLRDSVVAIIQTESQNTRFLETRNITDTTCKRLATKDRYLQVWPESIQTFRWQSKTGT